MATLNDLRDAHEEMVELAYKYLVILTAIIEDEDEPQAKRDELLFYAEQARENVTSACKIIAHLETNKEQP